jgi:hypothetical protein
MATNDHYEADAYIETLGKKVAKIASEAHSSLVGQGCSSYVKTIYIGYDLDGVMVAALYAHAEYVEVALALEESHKSNILIDATHLTWRTLPVAAVLKSKDDLRQFSQLAKAACMNITTGGHIVNRDNEFFAAAKRERQDKGIKPKEAKTE